MPQLDIRDLTASYGNAPVLHGVSLSIERGEVVSLIGPSGSGKSTLLRVLIGLTAPGGGEIQVEGERIDYGRRAAVTRLRDRMTIVFQQYNLFQNMTVLANVEFAPVHVKKRPPAQARREAEQLLVKIGLGDYLGRYPDQLSGGQQQRVAIARVLALKPQLLLLDEVTAALDPEMVNQAHARRHFLAVERREILHERLAAGRLDSRRRGWRE